VEDHLLHMLGQLIEWLLQLEGQMAREALQQLEVELIAPIPALDRPGRKREVRKDDHALGIEKRDGSEPVAARTRPHWIVEREQARLQLGERVAADGTGKLGGIQMFDAGIHFDADGASIAMAQSGLEGLGQALL